MNNKNLLNILFLSALSFSISNKAIADIYCPQYVFCVSGTCKPNADDPSYSYFHQNQNTYDKIPTNGKYRFHIAYFSIQTGNQSSASCEYEQNSDKKVYMGASEPLYADFTDINNSWTTTSDDYKKAGYYCYGEPKNCPFQTNPAKFIKK